MMQKDDRTWAIFCHLSGFLGYVFPFGSILAPLVIWLIKKQDSKYLDETGKEVVNFQISIVIYTIISGILAIVLIGFVLLFILFLIHIIFMIKGAMSADKGQVYKYPFTLHLIK